MNKYITLVLIASYAFHPTTTLPQGAPETVCNTLLPFHGGGIAPMVSAPPFRISTERDAVNQGQTLRIVIESNPPELTFGGFMIQARNIHTPYQVVSINL